MSSSDGFCSTLSFAPGELGQPYTAPVASTASATNNTPVPTPTHATSPAVVKPSPVSVATGSQPASMNAAPRSSSPARSNSTSSVATISAQQSAGTVINNPTPTLGSVPLVTAANSAQPPTLPLTTPPQTPMSAVSHSATSSISGSVLGKRDIGAASESEKEETKEQSKETQQQQQQQPKKRRIAPTLVSAGGNVSAGDNNNSNNDVGG